MKSQKWKKKSITYFKTVLPRKTEISDRDFTLYRAEISVNLAANCGSEILTEIWSPLQYLSPRTEISARYQRDIAEINCIAKKSATPKQKLWKESSKPKFSYCLQHFPTTCPQLLTFCRNALLLYFIFRFCLFILFA